MTWREAEWPHAEFIVGNPPFLGDRKMIAGLGEEYVEAVRSVYDGRVLGRSDLVCYWFAKALDALAAGASARVGLVATNSISGGNNLLVLTRIADRALIFEAWSDEEWTIEGAAVRVALVCFATSPKDQPRLDGRVVDEINADLSAGALKVYSAIRLRENAGVSFIGTQKNGAFDIPGNLARDWLRSPLNPNGKPNSVVLKPWANGQDITNRPSDRWIIDFGVRMPEGDASLFEQPFQHVVEKVRPDRANLRRKWHRTYWWLHGDPRPALRVAIRKLERFIDTPRVAKHRLFVWMPSVCLPDSATVAIARDDNSTFGLLHSRFHEAWSLRLGTWLGVGNDPRYTPTTTFETFPFPEGLTPNIPATDNADDPRAIAIAKAAKQLDELRNAWLNPPDLVKIEPEVVEGYPDRILPKDAEAEVTLKSRTLTKLYNERPQWLDEAHRDLDAAVAAAYGWPADISEEDALAKLLELNLERAAKEAEQSKALPKKREVAGPSGGTEGTRAQKLNTKKPEKAVSVIIGRDAFAKISAVEGIHLTDEAREAFAEFDRRKLTPEERRRAIIARFKREAAE